MQKLWIQKLVYSALACLALGAVPAKSFAAVTVYPGSICKPEFAGDYTVDKATGFSLFGTYGGQVFQAYKNKLTVTCPITRHNATNTNGIKQVFVGVNIGQDARKVTCTLSAADAYGSTATSSTMSTTWAQPYARSQTLWFPGTVGTSQQYTGYTLSCFMEAANAEIQRIVVEEF